MKTNNNYSLITIMYCMNNLCKRNASKNTETSRKGKPVKCEIIRDVYAKTKQIIKTALAY